MGTTEIGMRELLPSKHITKTTLIEFVLVKNFDKHKIIKCRMVHYI